MPNVPDSLEAQIAEIDRELAMRKAAYPKWIRDGRLSQTQADRQMAAMQAVASTLRRMKERQATEAGSGGRDAEPQ